MINFLKRWLLVSLVVYVATIGFFMGGFILYVSVDTIINMNYTWPNIVVTALVTGPAIVGLILALFFKAELDIEVNRLEQEDEE